MFLVIELLRMNTNDSDRLAHMMHAQSGECLVSWTLVWGHQCIYVGAYYKNKYIELTRYRIPSGYCLMSNWNFCVAIVQIDP